MSSSASRERAKRYVTSMLAINPLWQSRQALELRHRVLRLPDVPGGFSSDNASQQDHGAKQAALQHGRQSIKDLQDNFYTLAIEDLNHQLDAIDVSELPQLRPVVNRMRVVAANRGVIAQMFQDEKMDRPLLQAFRKSLVASPADAGYLKEQYIQSLTNKKKQAAAKRTAERVAQHYPELHRLEKDWFETLQRPGSGKILTTSGFQLGWRFFLAFIVIRILIQIFQAAGD